MSRDKNRSPRIAAILMGTVALALWADPARAQWGMGLGMGWGWGWGGFGGFNYVPSPTNFLNQQALSNAARAGAPTSNRPYANSPNAYYNRVRDNGFVPQYDVQARRPSTERVQRSSSMASRPSHVQPTAAAATRPIIPLASFFDQSMRLGWPAEAPLDGDLKEKRAVSDEASLAVLTETRQHGTASLSTVADARQKLLNYGRPALKEVRASNTPRVADTFHLFLLSLYESLAQAAMPTDEAPPPPPSR
jgi:hypothetical protein